MVLGDSWPSFQFSRFLICLSSVGRVYYNVICEACFRGGESTKRVTPYKYK